MSFRTNLQYLRAQRNMTQERIGNRPRHDCRRHDR